MTSVRRNRRTLLAGLGAAATTAALGSPAAAQAASTPFEPARHEIDAWIGAMPGKHRVVLDVVTPAGVPDGIRFAGNLFNGNKSGYGVEETELALIMVIRHSATSFGFSNAMWAKYGKTFDSKADTPPTANPYDSGARTQLSALAKRGVQFMICGSASRGIAGRVAGKDGDADAVLKEFSANLIPNARMVSAGVVGVTHAQEYGFSLLYAG
ncbi:MAG TPA: hypothetical protein VMW48_14290 [Vicinamibacterales bacterium]|nr:hypothetical protein [Vicinamibacterales bacterium]